MKAYKIDLSGFTGKVREVVSEAVQKKAVALGYAWPDGGNDIRYVYDPYLYLEQSGKLLGGIREEFFEDDDNTPITADAFLALTTAKDEPGFKPFDRVLVRDHDDSTWTCDLYSNKSDSPNYPYGCLSSRYRQCIPYEGNEALLGTTDSPE